MGPFLLSSPSCPLRPQLTVARSFAGRLALEEDGAKPPHAKRNLVSEPGAGRGGGTLGYSTSF